MMTDILTSDHPGPETELAGDNFMTITLTNAMIPRPQIRKPARGSRAISLPDYQRAEKALREYTRRLLQASLLEARDPNHVKLLRLAAIEAEALAWQTPFPFLFLPVLLEEKLEAIRRYMELQACLRRAYH